MKRYTDSNLDMGYGMTGEPLESLLRLSHRTAHNLELLTTSKRENKNAKVFHILWERKSGIEKFGNLGLDFSTRPRILFS